MRGAACSSGTSKLHGSFQSLWAMESEPRPWSDMMLPACYRVSPAPATALSKLDRFHESTLFYIFYCMPRDILQLAAASELYAARRRHACAARRGCWRAR